jgi:hypothetical protein
MTPDAPPLVAHLVDDAGLFPPAALPMPAALARHRHDDAAGSAVLTGRFLCPVGELDALVCQLTPGDNLRIGLITPLEASAIERAVEQVAAEPRIELAGVEGPLGDLTALAGVPAGVPCFVETPPGELAAIGRVAAAGYGAKVRCGGLRAELFPTADELAAFISTCASAGVPFKATAGLHHALPYRDRQTGFDHHGFLNLVLATAHAVDGAGAADVAAVLRSTDREALVHEARAVPDEPAAATRRVFVAYGSCSTAEPVAELDGLGLLHAQRSPA